MAVKAIPDEYPRVIPYLAVDDAAAAIDFYSKVLGATERMRMPGPDGKVAHAELQIGDSMIMLSDPFPGQPQQSPKEVGGNSVSVMVYVEGVDNVFKTAIEAGATEVQPLQDQFYGDRSGQFKDPFGHIWNVASHIEDVSPEEMSKRMAAMGG
jgi:PhnB protein